MSKEYPLFPELSEEGGLAAEAVIERAKAKLKTVCAEALGEIYINIPAYIGSDSWTNFRNDLMAGFRDYGNRKIQGDYDFKVIRQQIYKDFRAEIIADLNQDHLEEIEKLRKEVSELHARLERRGRYE